MQNARLRYTGLLCRGATIVAYIFIVLCTLILALAPDGTRVTLWAATGAFIVANKYWLVAMVGMGALCLYLTWRADSDADRISKRAEDAVSECSSRSYCSRRRAMTTLAAVETFLSQYEHGDDGRFFLRVGNRRRYLPGSLGLMRNLLEALEDLRKEDRRKWRKP